ncbi:MAG: sigma-70 family RNA polymerase sigma factor [Acidobacteria bacterium]|jgi:RNA polymerase sigma-70 factor (ECF subfamily)|nr:sigma-70 family RNA polymerase sigma factor [Acidobacteriota bacterium]
MTDARVFEAFLLEYQDMVYATAFRLLGNAMEAEDVAQTVFMKAFEQFDQVGTSPSAPGWLKTVTTNACLNHLSRYRNRWRFFSELTSAEAHSVDSRTSGPQDSGAQDPGPWTLDPGPKDSGTPGLLDSDSSLDLALRRLPAHQRVPIVLFHFDDLTYQQIAERLNISLGKVKTDIHRGREALRAALAAANEGALR